MWSTDRVSYCRCRSPLTFQPSVLPGSLLLLPRAGAFLPCDGHQERAVLHRVQRFSEIVGKDEHLADSNSVRASGSLHLQLPCEHVQRSGTRGRAGVDGVSRSKMHQGDAQGLGFGERFGGVARAGTRDLSLELTIFCVQDIAQILSSDGMCSADRAARSLSIG